MDKAKFEDVLDDIKAEKGVKFDTDLDADDLKEVKIVVAENRMVTYFAA